MMRTVNRAFGRLATGLAGVMLSRGAGFATVVGLCGRVAFVAAALVLVPLSASGQSSASDYRFLADYLGEHSERLYQVDIYVMRIALNQFPGMKAVFSDGAQGPRCTSNCVVYKVETVENPDGTQSRQERALSALEVQTLAGMSPGAEFMELYAYAMFGAQEQLNANTGGEDIDSVFDGIVKKDWLPGTTDLSGTEINPIVLESRQPWLNPHRMLAAGGFMMLETSMAVREAEISLATSAIQAQAEANEVSEVVAQLEEVGVEELEGGPATRYSLAGVNALMDTVDGHEVFFNGASIWIDNDEYVIAAHRIEGTMVANGASRPFFLEVRNSDFRQVPGCTLYEPYRRVTRMGGLLDDAQMAQMEEARQQLEEFDRKMASMPASQRSMMEKMMGGQMDTLRNMANGGTLEYVQEIEEILCNPDLKALFSVAPGGPVALGVDLAEIQERLVTLGYEPGNTDGVLDTLTQIAISQFEADHGMAVTGEPSFQLATALAAAVAG